MLDKESRVKPDSLSWGLLYPVTILQVAKLFSNYITRYYIYTYIYLLGTLSRVILLTATFSTYMYFTTLSILNINKE